MRTLSVAVASAVAASLSLVPAWALETGSIDKTITRQAIVGPELAAPPAVVPVESPLQQAIRLRLGNARIEATPLEKAAIVAVYEVEARSSAGLYASSTGLTPLARAVIAELKAAEDWGLPVILPPAKVLAANGVALDDVARAEVEVELSLAVLTYARYARGGRIEDPAKQLASTLDRKPQLAEPRAVLDAVATGGGAALTGFNPRHAAFEALRKAYNEARRINAPADSTESLANGPSLKLGVKHASVPVVRQLLKVAPGPAAEPSDLALYDATVAAAVVAFQKAQGLEPADGIVGPKTRAALRSLQPPSRATLAANMEQWRWMPAELGDTHIHVNIPEFAFRLMKSGTLAHTERVVTGLTTNQTPVFSETLKTVVLQPDWVLPESIKIKEALPSLLSGSGMFWDSGLKIRRGKEEIDPGDVDWGSADLRAYTFYQPPGDSNALGQVKFLFPNKHAVYMHDTPAKHLFDRTERAFSHGCMRVRNPVRLAELVLEHDQGLKPDQVRTFLDEGPEDNRVKLQRPIPVHVTYFTAVPDANGRIRVLPDVYGHEKRITLALAGRWSEIDVPADHLAPIEDREFETRAAAPAKRQKVVAQYQQQRPQRQQWQESPQRRSRDSGGSDFERALKTFLGGF